MFKRSVTDVIERFNSCSFQVYNVYSNYIYKIAGA